MISTHVACMVPLALHWLEWMSTVSTVGQCILATGQAGGLHSAHLVGTALFVGGVAVSAMSLFLLLSAYRASRLYCTRQRKDSPGNTPSHMSRDVSPLRLFQNRESSSSSSSPGNNASPVYQGSRGQSGPTSWCRRFFSMLCTVRLGSRNKDLQAEVTALREQNARLLLEKQVAMQAQRFHGLTAPELCSFRNKFSVFLTAMTSEQIIDLLGAVNPGHLTTTDAAQLTIAELIMGLIASNTALDAQTAKLSALQAEMSITNEAFAALLRAAMDSSKTSHQLSQDLKHANRAVHEGQHKLADASNKISQLTTELTQALTSGRHDRSRLCEMSLDFKLEQKLHSISTHTCAKLRKQKNVMKLQVQVLQALLAGRNNNDNSIIQQTLDSNLLHMPTQSQGKSTTAESVSTSTQIFNQGNDTNDIRIHRWSWMTVWVKMLAMSLLAGCFSCLAYVLTCSNVQDDLMPT